VYLNLSVAKPILITKKFQKLFSSVSFWRKAEEADLKTRIRELKKCFNSIKRTFQIGIWIKCIHSRAVARSKNPGGLVVLSGDNVAPLVEIGLTDLPKTGGSAPTLATGL
jgi:hypothetical protein